MDNITKLVRSTEMPPALKIGALLFLSPLVALVVVSTISIFAIVGRGVVVGIIEDMVDVVVVVSIVGRGVVVGIVEDMVDVVVVVAIVGRGVVVGIVEDMVALPSAATFASKMTSKAQSGNPVIGFIWLVPENFGAMYVGLHPFLRYK